MNLGSVTPDGAIKLLQHLYDPHPQSCRWLQDKNLTNVGNQVTGIRGLISPMSKATRLSILQLFVTEVPFHLSCAAITIRGSRARRYNRPTLGVVSAGMDVLW